MRLSPLERRNLAVLLSERRLAAARVDERLERDVADRRRRLPIASAPVLIVRCAGVDGHAAYSTARRSLCGLHVEQPVAAGEPSCADCAAELRRHRLLGLAASADEVQAETCNGVTRKGTRCHRGVGPASRLYCPSHKHLDPAVAAHVTPPPVAPPEPRPAPPPFPRRELEVLGLLAAGFESAAIATRLELSTHTVKKARQLAVHRLRARNSCHAVAIAIRRGLVSPPPR